jgi:peptidoglycan-N-acetylglucosamine deacetylase
VLGTSGSVSLRNVSLLLVAALGCSEAPSAPADRPPGSAGAATSGGAAGNAGTVANSGAGAGGAVTGGAPGAGAAGSSGSTGTTGGAGSGGGGGGAVLGVWPENAVAAVTLTYDDGLDTHLHIAAPALDAAGLKGTFFLSNFEGADHDWALPNANFQLTARHQAWAAMATKGHELASHTVNHPCNSETKAANYHLTDYDTARMAAELDDSMARLAHLGAPAPYTFAYPCSSDTIGLGPGGEDYSPLIAERFFAARVSVDGIANPEAVEFLHVSNVDTGGKTGDELRAEVDQAIAQGGWLVFLFHGVGDETSCDNALQYAPETCMINYLVTSEAAHASLVSYLAEKQSQVWTATFKQVVEGIAGR